MFKTLQHDIKINKMEENEFDVIIIGGSYAGLAAAMSLGRALRKVLIIDSGKPCNRQTPHSHNFLTQDGHTPAEIRSVALKQVLAYPTVRVTDDEVLSVDGENLDFQVTTKGGEHLRAKKVLFATGILDKMLPIEGFAACWGISVIHCPYCHGYEYHNEPTGLLVPGDMVLERGRFIRNWTKKLYVFTNGDRVINAAHREELQSMKIELIETPIYRIVHHNGHLERIVLSDDSEVVLKALYAHVPFDQHCKLPEQMGCALKDSGHLEVDVFHQTTVSGIYAAGDNTSMFRSVSVAVAAGNMAGGGINHELIINGY